MTAKKRCHTTYVRQDVQYGSQNSCLLYYRITPPEAEQVISIYVCWGCPGVAAPVSRAGGKALRGRVRSPGFVRHAARCRDGGKRRPCRPRAPAPSAFGAASPPALRRHPRPAPPLYKCELTFTLVILTFTFVIYVCCAVSGRLRPRLSITGVILPPGMVNMLYNIFQRVYNCNDGLRRSAPRRPAPLARRYRGDLVTLPPAPPAGATSLHSSAPAPR